MELSERVMREAMAEYFETRIVPEINKVVKRLVASNGLMQDCIPLAEAMIRYKLSRGTFYNYHNRGYISLYSTEGRTYVSRSEMESWIKNNPIPPASQLS